MPELGGPTWRKRGEAAVNAHQAFLEVVERQQVTESRLQDGLVMLRLRDSALDPISQGVSTADAAGRITYTNRACEQMTGYAAKEMSGRTAGMLQGPGTNPARRKALRDAIADALPFHGKC